MPAIQLPQRRFLVLRRCDHGEPLARVLLIGRGLRGGWGCHRGPNKARCKGVMPVSTADQALSRMNSSISTLGQGFAYLT